MTLRSLHSSGGDRQEIKKQIDIESNVRSNECYAERHVFLRLTIPPGWSLEPSLGHIELMKNHIMYLLFPHLPPSRHIHRSETALRAKM